MDRGTSPTQTPAPGNLPTGTGAGAQPCPGAPPPARAVLNLGEALVKTQRHFWPEFNAWLDQIPDTRFAPMIVYDKRFLVWWGLSLFFLQLGSRRQLDFDLDAHGTQVLPNFNRLAQTQQDTRPVHDTLNHFLGHTGAAPYARLRTQMVYRLLRMKVLDSARLQGRFVVALDATGHVAFRYHHCPQCLVYQHEHYTSYLHQMLEAKLLGPAGLVLSMASEAIENSDANATNAHATDAATDAPATAEERKQDCELKALSRLLPALRRDYPQLALCLAGDGLYACGRTLELAKDHRCAYVLSFQPGRLPAVWQEFQTLLSLCPENTLERRTAEGAQQVYRWLHDLSYVDDQGRTWSFHAIQCQETVDGQTTTFAWITDLEVNAKTVVDIATKGGRHRWHIENQGFNRQKNSGFNLEHAFGTDPEMLKAYYYLLQIAHMLMQVLEAGSLLRQLAADCGRTPAQLFGSLKNIARRLLECFRYFALADDAFDPHQAARIQIRLDDP